MGNESDLLMAKYQLGLISSLMSNNTVYNLTKTANPDRV